MKESLSQYQRKYSLWFSFVFYRCVATKYPEVSEKQSVSIHRETESDSGIWRRKSPHKKNCNISTNMAYT